ncbi:MAG: hypothetical protein QW046_04680 [Candidatus Micrarchaeaceae archaeon]
MERLVLSRVDYTKRIPIAIIAMCFEITPYEVELGLALHADMTELIIKNEDINDDENYQKEIQIFGSEARLKKAIRAAKTMDLISIKKKRIGRAIYIRKKPDDFYNKVVRFIDEVKDEIKKIADKPETRPKVKLDDIYYKYRKIAIDSMNKRMTKISDKL